eukprot:10656923-Karenia_brevis.AAC.1
MKKDLSVEALIKSKSVFEADKSLKLHKPITFFKGGEQLLEDVDAAILQRTTDEEHLNDMTQLCELMTSLTDVTSEAR